MRMAAFRVFFVSSLALALSVSAEIVTQDITETGKTAQQLVHEIAREGEIGSIQNVALAGMSTQFGTFEGGEQAIGLESGILLGSGHVTDIDGSNDKQLDSGQVNSGSSNDSQLENAHAYDIASTDAASLSFSFVPQHGQIEMNYVFGSEEYFYPGLTDYQDAVAIFVNGKNCAVVDTDTSVNVNTINGDKNSDLFIDNADGSRGIELHGFTTVLQCKATVNPNEPNEMKIVIADGHLAGFDAAIFISTKSFGTAIGFPCMAHPPRGLCMRPVTGGDYRLPSCQIDSCKAGFSIDEAGDQCCDIKFVKAHRRCPVDAAREMILGRVLCCDEVTVEAAKPLNHKLCLA